MPVPEPWRDPDASANRVSGLGIATNLDLDTS